ncbi:unnamed protein product, partial [Staurois parvus]
MFWYEIIVLKKVIFFIFSNLPPVPAPVHSDVTGTGTWKPDAGIGRRRWPGMLQETH